jgi:hypothetical protein
VKGDVAYGVPCSVHSLPAPLLAVQNADMVTLKIEDVKRGLMSMEMGKVVDDDDVDLAGSAS